MQGDAPRAEMDGFTARRTLKYGSLTAGGADDVDALKIDVLIDRDCLRRVGLKSNRVFRRCRAASVIPCRGGAVERPCVGIPPAVLASGGRKCVFSGLAPAGGQKRKNRQGLSHVGKKSEQKIADCESDVNLNL